MAHTVSKKTYTKDTVVKKVDRVRRRAGIRLKAGEQLVLYTARHTFGTEGTGKVTDMELAEVTRAAASHLRVGTFQYLAARRDDLTLRTLADYSIDRHFPERTDAPRKYLEFFRSVMDRQAALIARWQLVGFIHGVMNTDNMSISGETID